MSDRECKNCERPQRGQYCEPCGVWTMTEAEELAECEAADALQRKADFDNRMIALFSQCFNSPARA